MVKSIGNWRHIFTFHPLLLFVGRSNGVYDNDRVLAFYSRKNLWSPLAYIYIYM
jgi:hypothetical protein